LKLRIDLHVHTNYSRDSLIKIEELVPRCRAAGLDGLAVTDHENLEGGRKAAEKCKEILVIPGMEIETPSGHVLALNVTGPVKRGLSLSETIKSIHELSGIAVIAHPFSLLKPLIDVNALTASDLDAVEAANASSFPYSLTSRMSTALAKRLNLPMTGGSDAHLSSFIGRSYTVVDSDSKEISDIIEAVRKGRTEAKGEGVTLKERALKIIKRH
jgi:hypothetical protein